MDMCAVCEGQLSLLPGVVGNEPAMHLFPHWDWEGKDGQEISVWCYANCESVELFLNGASVGSQTVKKNGHLEWKVKYAPGAIEARGSSGDKVVLTERRETAGAAARLVVEASKATLRADGQDCAQVNVRVVDAKGLTVPTAGNMLTFAGGAGEGADCAGNGDPSCHEPDKASQRSVHGLGAGLAGVVQRWARW